MILVPVKDLDGAKERLSPVLAPAERRALAQAMLEDVCQALGVDPPIYRRRMDFFWSDVEFDTSRARRVLDWAPTVDLPEGIRRTRDDYRRAGALPAEERAA